MFPFIQITIFNSKESSIWPLNLAIENNYHTYNYFTKVYYFNCPVMMSSFHLAPQKLPVNLQCSKQSLLSVRKSLSTNNTIFVIGHTNSRWSAPNASTSLSLIVRTILCLSGKRLNYAGNLPMILIGVGFQKNNVYLLKVSLFPSA